jgi:Flp pilus assembly protein TadG
MKRLLSSFIRRFLKDERGQSAAVLMVSISATMGLAGMSIETAHVYYAYRLLQASTNAAALAGAYSMPGTVSGIVTEYSAETGDLNANQLLTNVSISSSQVCLSTVTTDLDVDCVNASGGTTGGANALVVTQKATVPLWFGGLVGFKNLSIEAVATAAMRGGANTPWNIAIIQDTTDSMNDKDSGDQCTGTQITCSLLGMQALLNDLYPCGLGQTCSNSGVAAVDSVSLFVFPAVVSTTASKDYVCNTSDPTIVAYTFPNTSTAYTAGTAPGTNLQLPSGDTYQILGFQNNYKTTDMATALNQAAGIVIAAGDSGKSGCSGLQAPGGEGTYYAQAIYAAQAALVTQQANNPGSKNAMIILSDGDATACASNANTTAGACNTKAQIVATEGTLNGTGTSKTNANGYENPTYPSALGECGQAVLAAQYAATQGTTVYTIGYGSETSGGCLSDKTYSASVTTNGGPWGPGDQPCQAIAAMASAEVNFYSDDGQGCQATAPSNQSLTKLTAIFRAITNNLTIARLIPNGSS